MAFTVDDIEAEVADLRARGVVFETYAEPGHGRRHRDDRAGSGRLVPGPAAQPARASPVRRAGRLMATTEDAFPTDGVTLSHLLVVADLDRSVAFYRDVLGADLDRIYGGSTAVLQFAGSWILLTTAGDPTPDKPGISFAPPAGDGTTASAEFRPGARCRAAHAVLAGRGSHVPDPATRLGLRDPLLLPRPGREPARDQLDPGLTAISAGGTSSGARRGISRRDRAGARPGTGGARRGRTRRRSPGPRP